LCYPAWGRVRSWFPNQCHVAWPDKCSGPGPWFDVVSICGYWGTGDSSGEGDFDGDDSAGIFDLDVMAANWGHGTAPEQPVDFAAARQAALTRNAEGDAEDATSILPAAACSGIAVILIVCMTLAFPLLGSLRCCDEDQ